MQKLRDARIDLLALVEKTSAAAHVRGRPFVRHPLAHHERRRDAERPERPLELRDPIARRLQRGRDGPIRRRQILTLLLGPIS